MKQVIENMKTGQVQLIESPLPQCGAGEVLVKNMASLISPGTEKLLIEMGKKSLVGKAFARKDLVALAIEKGKREGFLNVFREAMARLDQPLPLGYSSAGQVLQVGRNVTGIVPGDRVACAGFTFASHAEVIAVPQELCVPLPQAGAGGASMAYEDASFVMLGGIALQGVRCARLTFGENIAVVGLGLIGLLTMQIAKAYGCKTIGIDVNPEKVKRARMLGCDFGFILGSDDLEPVIQNITDGHGADAVILTAATKDNSPILLSERIARKRGRIVLVGVSDLTLTRKAFWEKELSFTVSKASGHSTDGRGSQFEMPVEAARWTESRNLKEFVRLLHTGALNVHDLVTHRYSIDQAPAAYDMILEGNEPYIGVLINYPAEYSDARSVPLQKTVAGDHRTSDGRKRLGLIGAGMFTKNILLPLLAKRRDLECVGIAAKSGMTSAHVGKTFGFQYATTEYSRLLKDDAVGSVMITTRHDLHAAMVLESLQSGKHVFVEKPLCIRREELDRCTAALSSLPPDRMFMVGFNRRHSPLARSLKESFGKRTTPVQIVYRVNAGFIPQEHWTQRSEVGGGRIIGEVCHMIDLLQFLTDADPVEVATTSIRGSTGQFAHEDNVSLSMKFSDGSLGTIIYTAMGAKTFSRERIEAYSGGRVGVIDDFRHLELIQGTRRSKRRLMSQDMGYAAELTAFFEGDPANGREHLRSAIVTTMASFCAVESHHTGDSVIIPRIGSQG